MESDREGGWGVEGVCQLNMWRSSRLSWMLFLCLLSTSCCWLTLSAAAVPASCSQLGGSCCQSNHHHHRLPPHPHLP